MFPCAAAVYRKGRAADEGPLINVTSCYDAGRLPPQLPKQVGELCHAEALFHSVGHRAAIRPRNLSKN